MLGLYDRRRGTPTLRRRHVAAGARGQRRDSPAGRCRVPCQRVAHRAEAISSSGPEEVLPRSRQH